jgi:PRTRC genetic system ThiF family protein
MPEPLNTEILDARPVTLRAWTTLDLILVGCGGTGSWLAPHLARFAALLGEGGKRVRLTFCDPDTVEPVNLARQHFCRAEVGAPKAATLARRYGTAWGLDIAARMARFSPDVLPRIYDQPILLVGCVDNAAARRALADGCRERNAALSRGAPPTVWWLDCGNHAQAGQVLLGTTLHPADLQPAFEPAALCRMLPSPALQHPELLEARPEEVSAPRLSCAELALANAQSLTINQAVAAVAADYVLRLLVTGDLRRFATYLDLPSGVQTSRYTTPAAVARVIGQDAAFFAPPAPEVPPSNGRRRRRERVAAAA